MNGFKSATYENGYIINGSGNVAYKSEHTTYQIPHVTHKFAHYIAHGIILQKALHNLDPETRANHSLEIVCYDTFRSNMFPTLKLKNNFKSTKPALFYFRLLLPCNYVLQIFCSFQQIVINSSPYHQGVI